jgi:hypothetical protein
MPEGSGFIISNGGKVDLGFIDKIISQVFPKIALKYL